MKYLLSFLVLILVGAALFVGCSNRDGYDPARYARQQAEALRIEQAAELDAQWAPVRAAALNLSFVALCILVVVGAALGGGAALARFRYERRPDARGLLPVLRSELGGVGPAALADHHITERARASIAPVPASLNYAPHVHHHRADGERAAGDAPDEQPAPLQLPGLTDLVSIGHAPTPQSILLALGAGGAPITVPAKALCHVALCGATGQGKSNLLRLIVPQLQVMGARVVLADPHYTDLDPESGEDWRPIRQRLHMAPAVQPSEIKELFGWLVAELRRRLTLRRQGQPWGKPLFFALDELPVIVKRVDEAPEQLGEILREGRKVSMYVVGASQEFLIKLIGGTSGARDAYRTAFYVGGDLVSASALLDLRQRDIDEGALVGGVAYLRSVATSPAQLVRVPYASNAAITALLATSAPTSAEVVSAPLVTPAEVGAEVVSEVAPEVAQPLPLRGRQDALNPRSARVRELLLAGTPASAIIREVWEVERGDAYKKAARELAQITAQLLGAQGGG